MKVLLIDVNCKSSSTGKIVYNLYSYLNMHGDEAAICYGRGENIKERGIFKFGIDIETNIHALLTRLTGYTGCYSFFSTRRLIKKIEEFKPDIIHIHELHAYFVNIKSLFIYLQRKRIRTIFTLHCEFDYTGKCGHALECEKWKTECSSCPHLKEYPSVYFFDHTNYMYRQKRDLFNHLPNSIITSVSPWLTDRARMSFLKNKELYTIYNGIDMDLFKPRDTTALKTSLGIKNKKVVVAVAANIMSVEKGGPFLETLAKQMPNIEFVLVGTETTKIIHKENIFYIPKVRNQIELAEYYSLGDVFVICSIKETFSLTCAEAICCGTPIAGFKCGAPEKIFEPPYALFVEYGDLKKLKNAVQIQLENKLDGIRIYGQKFSKTRMLEEYRILYQSIMNRAEGKK